MLIFLFAVYKDGMRAHTSMCVKIMHTNTPTLLGLVVVEDGEVLDRRNVDAFVCDGAFEERRLSRWLRRLFPNHGVPLGGDDDQVCWCWFKKRG